MKAICLYLQIHQPQRLRTYRFFDIGNHHYYYDDFANDDILKRVAEKSYIPACRTLLHMIETTGGAFRCAISVSGVALEQMEHAAPEVLDLLRCLADTGAVEFLAETYSHSLASLTDPEEFAAQVLEHDRKIHELFGQHPTVLRNTELIYADELAPMILGMGYKGVITEGAKNILGWKSPNYVYSAATAPELKLLLRNNVLTERITSSFQTEPITADSFVDMIASTTAAEEIFNLFMSMETFGAFNPDSSGIFAFLEALPRVAAERGVEFITPGEAVKRLPAVAQLEVGYAVSWADEARDTSSWLGNDLQNEAFRKLYSVAGRVRLCSDRRLKQDWRYLQSSDHLYYMSTRHTPGEAFSPYSSPFEAFTNYMNVLADFLVRVEEQYPASIENEELNALLTTIRNQSNEIEALNREVASMRKSVFKNIR